MADHRNNGKNIQAHSHGAIDPTILSTQKGIRAIKWSFVGLFVTAVFQIVVVGFSGSVAFPPTRSTTLAMPLRRSVWMPFRLSLRIPNKRFTYGDGRVEDLAGAFIVFMILLTAVIAG